MIKFIKSIFVVLAIFLMITAAIILLSYIKYPDNTQHIKPIAEKLVKNYYVKLQNRKDKLLTKDEIVLLLKESGCKKVTSIKSNIVKTEIANIENHFNNWFRANCISNKGKKFDIRLTARETLFPDFRIDYRHSYCFNVRGKEVNCFTQHLIALPGR